MNVFVKLKGYNDEDNDFFLDDLDGGPEEQWLLASLTSASQEKKMKAVRFLIIILFQMKI